MGPQNLAQGLKTVAISADYGMTEVMPCYKTLLFAYAPDIALQAG
jgi:hypothetical protein